MHGGQEELRMKKIKNLVIGGIENKIFNLVLLTMLLTFGAFMIMITIQTKSIEKIADESTSEQMESTQEITGQIMESVRNSAAVRITDMEAYIANDMFLDVASGVEILGDYASILFSEPEISDGRNAEDLIPDPANDGKAVLQLITAEGVDVTEDDLAEKIRLAAGMEDILTEFYEKTTMNACYIGLPEGVMLIVDEDSSGKISEDGSVLTFPITERPWFVAASEKGELCFTDVEINAVNGSPEIVCAVPIYSDGELQAVVGADLYLNEMDDYIAASDEDGSFAFIVNENGHVLFSPKDEGVLAPHNFTEALDLRETDEEGFSEFMRNAMEGSKEVQLVTLEGAEYYMIGSSMESVGWTIFSVISKEANDQPVLLMQEKEREISENSAGVFQNSLDRTKRSLRILLLIVTIICVAGALTVSKRIVKPLNLMTKRIAALSNGNLQFMMEDAFKTGDEIQVLAESFAAISQKAMQYMDEIKRVTAEKERIGVELEMAKEIQSSQLPSIFPPYPDRSEFDIFASMNPAKEVGGDFYDFFMTDENHLCLVMADVSGKGVPAALFMMIAKILIKNRVQGGEDLGDAISNVNNQLIEGNLLDMFVTVWLGALDIRTGDGTAVNAGHEHPVIRRAGGKYELVTYKHSVALATMEDIPYREHHFHLDPGDSLFVYTDGVPEANNEEGDFFGTDRMLDALNKDPEANAVDVILNMTEALDEFMAGADQFDDITMLCVKYFGPQGK